MSDPSATPPLLQARDIKKSFPGVQALSGVSFEVTPNTMMPCLKTDCVKSVGPPFIYTKENFDKFDF